MKVLLVNGSPHQKGCVYTALSEVAASMKAEGVDSDFYWIGVKPISGCIACGRCREKRRCVFEDKVNEFTELALNYDGFIYGTPVYFSGMNGSLASFMDRVFYSSSLQDPHPFRYKPSSAIVCARRAGTTSTLDQISKYLSYQCSPIVSSRYWNMVHGNTPEEVLQDKEGLQIMRQLGKNMAWVLKSLEAGRKAGIPLPEREETEWTNFIR